MNYDLLLIDGYNLMHQDRPPGQGALLPARQRLVRRIERGAAGLARQVAVVFDGCEEGGGDPALDSSFLRVIFSPSGRTADGVIEQMVYDAEDAARILVVTSDSIERRLVSVFGASVMSCREFLLRCGSEEAAPRFRTFGKRKNKGSTLGDFFPD